MFFAMGQEVVKQFIINGFNQKKTVMILLTTQLVSRGGGNQISPQIKQK